MSTINPNNSQAALFEKLGISSQTEAQKAKSDTLGQSDFFKTHDDTIAKPRPICTNG